jgi:hypothetical protein
LAFAGDSTMTRRLPLDEPVALAAVDLAAVAFEVDALVDGFLVVVVGMVGQVLWGARGGVG